MTEELALVGGVDRDLHGAELQRGEEADDLLGPVPEQRGHAVAVPHAHLRERVRESCGLLVHPPGRVLLAFEIEVRRVPLVPAPGGERLAERWLPPTAISTRRSASPSWTAAVRVAPARCHSGRTRSSGSRRGNASAHDTGVSGSSGHGEGSARTSLASANFGGCSSTTMTSSAS